MRNINSILIAILSYYASLAQWLELLFCKQGVVGSSPTRSSIFYIHIAQWLEHSPDTRKVTGSSPVMDTFISRCRADGYTRLVWDQDVASSILAT